MIPMRIPRLMLVLLGVSAFLAFLENIFQRFSFPHHAIVVLSGLVAGFLVFLLAFHGGRVLRFCGKGLVDVPQLHAKIRVALFDIGVLEERRARDRGDRRVRGLPLANIARERRRGPDRRQGGPAQGKSLLSVSVVDSARFIAFTVKEGRSHRAFISTRMVNSLSLPALRGVLAHEYGHVLNRHPLKQAVILGGLATVKMSVGVPIGAVVLALMAYLFLLREWEYAADAAAVLRTTATDVLAAFDEYRTLESMTEGEKKSRLFEWLSGHPGFEMSRLSELFSGHPSFDRRVSAIKRKQTPAASEAAQLG